MSDFKTIIQKLTFIHNTYADDCTKCPIRISGGCGKLPYCSDLIISNPDFIERTVTEWFEARENMVNTASRVINQINKSNEKNIRFINKNIEKICSSCKHGRYCKYYNNGHQVNVSGCMECIIDVATGVNKEY